MVLRGVNGSRVTNVPFLHSPNATAVPHYSQPPAAHRTAVTTAALPTAHSNELSTGSPRLRGCTITFAIIQLYYDIVRYDTISCRFEWLRGGRRASAAERLLGCGLESSRGHGCLSVVSDVCCQVEVSATD